MSLREWWRNKRRLATPPAHAVAALGEDERVVGWGFLDDGDAVLATQRGLWIPEQNETGVGRRRIDWHRVSKASWSSGSLLVVEGRIADDVVVDEQEPTAGELRDLAPIALRLREPRNLPPTVRKRVDHSVAYSTHHPIPPVGGVRVVARRVSGRDGLEWTVRYDEGTDSSDPWVEALVTTMLADSKVAVGLESD